MLKLDNEWKDNRYSRSKIVEYRASDFYGPFLSLNLEEFEGGEKKITPLSVTIETAEFSESHFSLIVKACRELYSEIGKFTIYIPQFKIEIEINSMDTEELILNKLIKEIKNLTLF